MLSSTSGIICFQPTLFETDMKTRLLNLHDALTTGNCPLDFEFHLKRSKVTNCGELTNDIIDNFNYENKETRTQKNLCLHHCKKYFIGKTNCSNQMEVSFFCTFKGRHPYIILHKGRQNWCVIRKREVSILRNVNYILLEEKALINKLIKQNHIKACFNDKLNNKIINHFFKYIERKEKIVTVSSFLYSSIKRDSYNSLIARVLMYENFFNNRLVLIPINQCEHHWLLVAVLLLCKKIVTQDSLHNNG